MEGIGSTAAAWKQYMKMSAQEKRNKNQCDHLYYTLSISNCKTLWLFYIHSFCYALSYTMSRYLVKVMYLWKPKRLLIWNGGSTWIVHNNHLTNDPKTELRSMDYTMPNMNIRIHSWLPPIQKVRFLVLVLVALWFRHGHACILRLREFGGVWLELEWVGVSARACLSWLAWGVLQFFPIFTS